MSSEHERRPRPAHLYDGHGRRVRDVVNGVAKHSQYLANGQLAFTADSRAMTVSEYIYLGDDLVAIRERDANTNLFTFRYQHNDALGSALVETDANRNVLTRTEYEPYGLTNRPTNDGPGYTGHVQDAKTGLTYMQQRYYDPGIGRFLSVDPVTAYDGDMRYFNRYWYAAGNPYKYTDPDGRAFQALWGAPIGAGVNIAVQMAMAEGSLGERFGQIKWGQVGIATAAGALSGGVSAIASTATTTAGTIGANVVGNMAVGALSTQANATLVEGRVASAAEVAKGATTSGITAGTGGALSAAPGVLAKSASAGMSQTERTATANLMRGIKEATPSFKHTNSLQTSANAAGNAVGASDGLAPLLEKKRGQ